MGRRYTGKPVLLFQKRFHAGLVGGTVTRTFRLWDKPHVKPKGRYRVHPIGVVEVDTLRHVTVGDLNEADALAGGFTSRAELLDYLRGVNPSVTDATPIFDVTLRHGGDGDRVEGALDTTLSPDEVEAVRSKLARLDRDGAWTRKVLALIGKHPRVAASQLAIRLGRETEPFKIDVRKLKKLGLTQSFEVGYEVSPRGVAFLSLEKRKPAQRAKKPAQKRKS
jgi:hypothetical protein